MEILNNLEVAWVVDGDTVHATKNGQLYKIRLTEIDAPERDQPFGKQSTDNFCALVCQEMYRVHEEP